MQANSTLVIADLHLIAKQTQKNQLFVKFCKTHATHAKQLFILGDLFNTWLGDDLSIPDYQPIINALKKLSETTDIFVIHGNRDFLLGAEFVKQTKAMIIQSPYLLTTHQQQYLLIHGDELCTDDKNYQRLKRIIQHPITKLIFLTLPHKLRLKLSTGLRKKSTQAQHHKTTQMMDVNDTAVAIMMEKYPAADLIHGHTHRLNTHTHLGFTRHVLGDWSPDQGNAIEIGKNLKRLEIY